MVFVSILTASFLRNTCFCRATKKAANLFQDLLLRVPLWWAVNIQLFMREDSDIIDRHPYVDC